MRAELAIEKLWLWVFASPKVRTLFRASEIHVLPGTVAKIAPVDPGLCYRARWKLWASNVQS